MSDINAINKSTPDAGAQSTSGMPASQREDSPRTVKPVDRPCGIGAFVADSNDPDFPNLVSGFKSVAGSLDYVNVFHSWGRELEDISETGFVPAPITALKQITRDGSTPFMVLEPFKFYREPGQPLLKLIDNDTNIHNNIKRLASELKAFGKPVLLCFAPAMNGTTFPWCGAFNGGAADSDGNGIADGPQNYVKAWQRIREIFDEAGTNNVKWVLSFEVSAGGGNPVTINEVLPYCPKDSKGNYLFDYIGLQQDSSAEDNRPFSEIFGPYIDQIKENMAGTPVIISQIGASSAPGQDWIRSAAGYVSEQNAKGSNIDSLLFFSRDDDSAYSVLNDNKGKSIYSPMEKPDQETERRLECEVRINEYRASHGYFFRERRNDADNRYGQALELLNHFRMTGLRADLTSAIAVLTGPEPAPGAEISDSEKWIPKSASCYNKSRLLLASVLIADDKRGKALSVYEAVIRDGDAEEGYRMNAVLKALPLYGQLGRTIPYDIQDVCSYDRVLEFGRSIKDPNIQSSAILGKAAELRKTNDIEGARELIDQIVKWEDIPSPSMTDKCWGFFLSLWLVKDTPFYVSDRSYFSQKGSVFFDDAVWNRPPLYEALTALAEITVSESDPENDRGDITAALSSLKELEILGRSNAGIDIERVRNAIRAAEIKLCLNSDAGENHVGNTINYILKTANDSRKDYDFRFGYALSGIQLVLDDKFYLPALFEGENPKDSYDALNLLYGAKVRVTCQAADKRTVEAEIPLFSISDEKLEHLTTEGKNLPVIDAKRKIIKSWRKDPWLMINAAMAFSRACTGYSRQLKKEGNNEEASKVLKEARQRLLEAEAHITTYSQLKYLNARGERVNPTIELKADALDKSLGERIDIISSYITGGRGYEKEVIESMFISLETKLIELESIEIENTCLNKPSPTPEDLKKALDFYTSAAEAYINSKYLISHFDDPINNNPWLKAGILKGIASATIALSINDKSLVTEEKAAAVHDALDRYLLPSLKFAHRYYSGREITNDELASPEKALPGILSEVEERNNNNPEALKATAQLYVYIINEIANAKALLGEVKMNNAVKANNKDDFTAAQKMVMDALGIKVFIRSLRSGSPNSPDMPGLEYARKACDNIFKDGTLEAIELKNIQKLSQSSVRFLKQPSENDGMLDVNDQLDHLNSKIE